MSSEVEYLTLEVIAKNGLKVDMNIIFYDHAMPGLYIHENFTWGKLKELIGHKTGLKKEALAIVPAGKNNNVKMNEWRDNEILSLTQKFLLRNIGNTPHINFGKFTLKSVLEHTELTHLKNIFEKNQCKERNFYVLSAQGVIATTSEIEKWIARALSRQANNDSETSSWGGYYEHRFLFPCEFPSIFINISDKTIFQVGGKEYLITEVSKQIADNVYQINIPNYALEAFWKKYELNSHKSEIEAFWKKYGGTLEEENVDFWLIKKLRTDPAGRPVYERINSINKEIRLDCALGKLIKKYCHTTNYTEKIPAPNTCFHFSNNFFNKKIPTLEKERKQWKLNVNQVIGLKAVSCLMKIPLASLEEALKQQNFVAVALKPNGLQIRFNVTNDESEYGQSFCEALENAGYGKFKPAKYKINQCVPAERIVIPHEDVQRFVTETCEMTVQDYEDLYEDFPSYKPSKSCLIQ